VVELGEINLVFGMIIAILSRFSYAGDTYIIKSQTLSCFSSFFALRNSYAGDTRIIKSQTFILFFLHLLPIHEAV
jgi:hypothetical protein